MRIFLGVLALTVTLAGCDGRSSLQSPATSETSSPQSVSAPTSSASTPVIASSAPAPTVSAPVASTSEVPVYWTYRSTKDDLRGTSSYFAELESYEKLGSLEGTPGVITLVLRKGADSSKDVLFFGPDANFACYIYSDCKVLYRFDNGPMKTLHLVSPESADHAVMFVQNPRAFTKELRRSKSLLIEFEFTMRGRQQYRFDTRGLEWTHW